MHVSNNLTLKLPLRAKVGSFTFGVVLSSAKQWYIMSC